MLTLDIKVIPKLDIHFKRMGATNTDDVDTKISPELIDGPTLNLGNARKLTINQL